jgi:L-arabinokinase
MVAAADVVLGKPGYGTVSECIAHNTALLYTSRGHFVEYDVFVREMPRMLRCRHISQDDLRAGRWSDAIDALLRQPEPPERPPTNGAEIAATEILNLAH